MPSNIPIEQPNEVSIESDLSDFEDDLMSKDEINRILSLENTSLLERLLWVNNLKLKKWQKEFSKQ